VILAAIGHDKLTDQQVLQYIDDGFQLAFKISALSVLVVSNLDTPVIYFLDESLQFGIANFGIVTWEHFCQVIKVNFESINVFKFCWPGIYTFEGLVQFNKRINEFFGVAKWGRFEIIESHV
jgi:hypothetical protein